MAESREKSEQFTIRCMCDLGYAATCQVHRTPGAVTTTYVPLSVPLADREKEELLRIIERYQDNLAWYVGERNRLMARIGRPRGHYDVAVEIIGVFLEYRDKHGKSETEAKHCAATEYEESEE